MVDSMKFNFPAAVPEIPVTDMDAALAYYKDNLGFNRLGRRRWWHRRDLKGRLPDVSHGP